MSLTLGFCRDAARRRVLTKPRATPHLRYAIYTSLTRWLRQSWCQADREKRGATAGWRGEQAGPTWQGGFRGDREAAAVQEREGGTAEHHQPGAVSWQTLHGPAASTNLCPFVLDVIPLSDVMNPARKISQPK